MEAASVLVSVPVGIYARISSDREGDQLGVTRQRADCEKLAAAKGWRVVDHYVDDDVSAWSGRPRPAYERMVEDLRAGVIRGVVVWHLDRLQRHPRELEAFIDLCDEVGVQTLACVTGDVDLGTVGGRMHARMLGIVARYESDHKSERILRKHQELALNGKVSGGGSRPYGYDKNRKKLVPAEAAIVKECARRLLAGESLRTITRDLNTRAEPAAGGGKWSPQSLRRMLHSARISGQREHHGVIVATKADWPAIITPAQTRKIRAILDDESRTTRREPRRYLLTGLLVCGQCGERLVARPRAGGQRRYSCASGEGLSGCGKIAIKADEVEQFVAEAVLFRLDTPAVAAAQARRPKEPDSKRWYAELEADRAQLAELAGMYGRKDITASEWRDARAPIEKRITAAKKQLAKSTRANRLEEFVGKGEALRRDWGALDLSQQHTIVSAVVDHVVVLPGRRGYNRFDESRLRPVWRA